MSDMPEKIRACLEDVARDGIQYGRWSERHANAAEELHGDVIYIRSDLYESQQAELARLREMVRWRDVREELPERGREVMARRLIHLPNRYCWSLAAYEHGLWTATEASKSDNEFLIWAAHEVTHWLPLPQLPEGT